MKTLSRDAFKILLCKLALGASALFTVLVLLALAQGALALLPGVLLFLLCLLVLNALCGLLAPAPRAKAYARRVPAGHAARRARLAALSRPGQARLHGAA